MTVMYITAIPFLKWILFNIRNKTTEFSNRKLFSLPSRKQLKKETPTKLILFWNALHESYPKYDKWLTFYSAPERVSVSDNI